MKTVLVKRTNKSLQRKGNPIMDELLSVLHVVTAVFIVGPMAILPMTAMRAMRRGDGGQVATLSKSTFVISLLSLLVVVFGFGVMGMADPKYNLSTGTPWILWSIILYLVALALSLGVIVPTLRKASAELLAGVGGAAKPAGYSRVAMSSGLTALLLVAVVVLMVWKP